LSIPLHILAADDEPDITASLKDYLESLGHRVDVAANGIEALNNISSAHREQDAYHLLLIDARMPLLDGVSLVRELRRGKDFTDIAFITGDPDLIVTLDEEAQHLGCLMVLAKPFEQAQLLQLVEFVGMRRGRKISSLGGATVSIARPAMPIEPNPGLPTLPTPADGQPATELPLSAMTPSLTPLPVVRAATPRPNDQPLHIPSGDDEYAPTSTRGPQTSTEASRNEKRSQTFYPDGGPPQEVRTPRSGIAAAPRSFVTPVPPDPMIVRPQPPVPPMAYQPPSAEPRSGRLAQPPRNGLPPIANPVNGQQLTRDPRYTSRIMQTGGIEPRPPIGPGLPQNAQSPQDPRRTSRIAPIATPLPQINPNGTDAFRKPPLMPPAAEAIRAALMGNVPPEPPRRTTTVHQRPPALPPQAPPYNSGANDATQSRLRRSVGGSVPVAGPAQEPGRMVGCAHCRGTFFAAIKPAAYNLVCVHCGRLNRINP